MPESSFTQPLNPPRATNGHHLTQGYAHAGGLKARIALYCLIAVVATAAAVLSFAATRRVHLAEALLRELAKSIANLPAQPPTNDNTGRATPTRQMSAWLLAPDHDAAASDLADLTIWLDHVYLGYPDARLPTCWLWHPHVIEELRWLRSAHADAYNPSTGSWSRIGDWHDRQRPGVVKRINDIGDTCELARHVSGGDRSRPPASVPFPTPPSA